MGTTTRTELARCAAGMLAAAALAFCAPPAEGITFNACQNNRSGKIRPASITTRSASCKSKETAVSWNSEGPQGTQGATGVTGPTGPTGPAGPGPSGPGKLVIPGAAFQSDGTGDDANFFFTFMGGTLTPAGVGACMQAAVTLPVGATITGFEEHVIDNDPADLMMFLRRLDNLTGVQDDMATVVTTGASTSVQDASTTTILAGTETVDTDHSYYATFCFMSGTAAFTVLAAAVSYTLP